MIAMFHDDDSGYIHWTERHPNGLILNVKTRSARESLIHTVDCTHFFPPSSGRKLTSYMKVCSDDRPTIEEWARDHGQHIIDCSTCMNG